MALSAKKRTLTNVYDQLRVTVDLAKESNEN